MTDRAATPDSAATSGAADVPEEIIARVGADLLDAYVACCTAMLAGARSSAEVPDGAGIGRWERARDRALAARRLCSTRDLARIGAAAIELRMAAEPSRPD